MDEDLTARLDRIEAILLKLLEALAGDDDDDEPSPFGAERDGDTPL